MAEKNLIEDRPDLSGWRIERAELLAHDEAMGQWYWQITFWYQSAGWPPELVLIVLMDGTVLEPEITTEPMSPIAPDDAQTSAG